MDCLDNIVQKIDRPINIRLQYGPTRFWISRINIRFVSDLIPSINDKLERVFYNLRILAELGPHVVPKLQLDNEL